MAKIIMAKTRKAQILMVQAKPTWGIRCWTISGKMTPPREEPATVSPEAMARLLRNHV